MVVVLYYMYVFVFTISILSLFFTEGTVDPADIEDLFDQLEDYSDSGPDADTISIGSTPKPSLKPFFCSSRNLLHEARSVVAAAAVAKAQSEYSSHIYLVQKPGFKTRVMGNSGLFSLCIRKILWIRQYFKRFFLIRL